MRPAAEATKTTQVTAYAALWEEEKKPETKYSSMTMQLGITAWQSAKESGLIKSR